AATLVIYHSTVADLWRLWTAADYPLYSHGLVLLVIAAHIFWRQWRRHNTETDRPSIVVGNLLLAAASITWFLARMGQVQLLQELCLLGIVFFLVWSLAGLRLAKQIVWSVLLVACAIPIWEFAAGILQAATVFATTQLLNATNISAVAEGTRILIREGTFVVEDACTGLGQHQTAVALALLYAYWNQTRVPVTLLYIAIAMLTAFLTNTIRVYIIIVAGHLTEMHHPLIKDHVWLGWVVFALAVFLLMSIAEKWRRRTWQ
ncbi:exosortase, partial [Petrachloros mirabilis]